MKLAVLVSGGGTNLQAIIDSIESGTITNAEIAVVISNNPNAYALERAKAHHIESKCVSPKSYESREAFNQALLEAIQSYQVDLVLLLLASIVLALVALGRKIAADARWRREKREAKRAGMLIPERPVVLGFAHGFGNALLTLTRTPLATLLIFFAGLGQVIMLKKKVL